MTSLEKDRSSYSFARLYGGGTNRKPKSSNGLSQKEMPQMTELQVKEGLSDPNSSPGRSRTQSGNGVNLTPGKSILQQIGTADHAGWMRKKGERYNNWKMRYFVLKGVHMYCLKSNNKLVSGCNGP